MTTAADPSSTSEVESTRKARSSEGEGMKKQPVVRDAVMAFLEESPWSQMGAIVANVTGQGISTEAGVQTVIRNLVACGSVKVDRSEYPYFRYALVDETRNVRCVPAERFEVPTELAGPIVSPMVWSMRHLPGVS